MIFIIFFGGFVWFNKSNSNTSQTPQAAQGDSLKIISTSPDPLDGAVLPPSTKSIEVGFNHPFSISVLKYKFEPELEHEVLASDSGNNSFGASYRFTFKEQLELGQSYTLTIFSDTRTDNNLSLGEDKSFHFKTIPFKEF